MKKTVLYLRVSTGEQDLAPQRKALTDYCASKGLAIDGEYCDIVSGSKEQRSGLDSLLGACEAGEIGRILTLRIDRVSRSLSGFLRLIETLNKLNVALVCPGQGINTEAETPEGMLMRHILAAFAEFERELIRGRTREGIAAAKAAGAICGRPSAVLVKNWREVVEQWKIEGTGYAKLAVMLGGVSKSTAWRLATRS